MFEDADLRRLLLVLHHGLVLTLVPGLEVQGKVGGATTILDLCLLLVASIEAEHTVHKAPVYISTCSFIDKLFYNAHLNVSVHFLVDIFIISTCHPELEKFPSGALHASQNCSWLNKAFSRHGIRAEVDCGMIIGYYFDV